ncbi:MAG TPA: hypothetical protein VFU22_07565 [Roseiflexaceae bacterium]|nr:hypothetical protein [Roseiflexaceae bacterium]
MNESIKSHRRGPAGLDGQQRMPQAPDELSRLLQQQVRRWPLATLGAAIVAGYLVGWRETTPTAIAASRSRRASGWMGQAIAQPGQHVIPRASAAAGSQGQRYADDSADAQRGRAPSQAPNASFAAGAGSGATGFDSPPVASSYLSNVDVGGPEQGQPYFPPGGAPDRDRGGQEQGRGHS